ncbi:hypothetical protein [Bosea sp. (in: a-proteobacteria)]|uniref:hypothetical protein n=1 Tax=Bosea sp. (in: a-proteobacteria) TaxID=1871050 RepID=UPI001AC3CDA1|nr:hypothetical protein [Bosea sp. (in: a-proteobacteria)]MBN9435787.1 hypothetical protein [Bosea sp. (in: a-proteobacteria)]
MTKNNQRGGRSLAPHTGGPVDEQNGTALRDPIALVTAIAGSDDPSLDELVAFRRQPIDLKAAARNAKALQNEEFRLGRSKELGDDQYEFACAGLQIMALSLVALVATWPADDLDQAEAKLALAERTGALHHRHEKDYVASMGAMHARRLRWKRAAFAVPELMLPPGPTAPQGNSRGLAAWPLERFDLVAGLPLRGGPPSFAHTQIAGWVGFTKAAPDLDHLLQRARKMFETCDRLVSLAQRGPENASALMVAAEGARIAGFLAAAQAMIWPVHNRLALAIKKEVVTLINLRGEIGDPIHMQAAIRHVTADAGWIKSLPVDARDDLVFDWSELV